MVTDPAHELAKIRPLLERIALALESIAMKGDPGFKPTGFKTTEQNPSATPSAGSPKNG